MSSIDLSFTSSDQEQAYLNGSRTKTSQLIKPIIGALLIFFIITWIIIASLYALNETKLTQKKATNLIYMVSDGMGPSAVTLARVCAAVEQLTLDRLLIGTARTYSSSQHVTDSAAAGTALACGLKTYNGAIGVNDERKPIGNIMEAAIEAGFHAGIVVTSIVQHATPAVFSAHSTDRDAYEFIAEQQITHGIELIFGGGSKYYDDELTAKAEDLGYTVFKSLDDFKNKDRTLPLVSVFSSSHMDYDLDRNPDTNPSLKEMVEAALELLTSHDDDKPFFLMIEGSRIDHAEHDNDVAAMVHDVLAYEETMQYLTSFISDRNNDTLLVSTSDHSTGGITLGRDGIYDFYPEIVMGVKHSIEYMTEKINFDDEPSTRVTVLSEMAGFSLQEHSAEIEAAEGKKDLHALLVSIISKKALIGWTTGGHTGVDVNIYAYGAQLERFQGNFNNIDLPHILADIFDLDLDAATSRLADFDPTAPARKEKRDQYHEEY